MPRLQFRDEIYENQKIVLDGFSWWACTFNECELTISTGDLNMDFCNLNNCKVLLEGNAATIAKVIKLFNPGLQIIERGA